MKRLLLVPAFLLVCLPASVAQTPEQKKATVEYLRSLQAEDGGFLPARPKEGGGKTASGLRATSSAIRALKYFGGEVPDLAACKGFVERCYVKEPGAFADRPGGKPDVFSTAVGAMAVVELSMPKTPFVQSVVNYLGGHAKTFDEIRIAAAGLEAFGVEAPRPDDWLKQIRQMQNADGTYGRGDGRARDTGSAVAAVLRLGGEVQNRDAVLKVLREGQRSDGGYGKAGAKTSDLETTYRVVRSLEMLKAKPPDVEALRRFVARCRNEDGGYGVAPGEPSGTSGTYFAGIILHWLSD